MAQGRFLTDIDLHAFANVTVIGSEVAEKLFPFGDPVGKSIRIGGQHYYEIIGVTAHKAPSAGTGSSLAAQDFNKDAYIPISTDRVRFGDVIANEKQGSFSAEKIELSQITVAVDEMDNVKRTSAALESLLSQFHPKKDYSVTVPLELLEKAEATKRIFNLVLGTIASISLVVGGIGIMNIMLATVTERTREIGIRRALGAKRRDITLPVPHRDGRAVGLRGLIGVLLGIGDPPRRRAVLGHPGGHPPLVADPRLLDRRLDRAGLRRLPRPTRRADGPRRGPPRRVGPCGRGHASSFGGGRRRAEFLLLGAGRVDGLVVVEVQALVDQARRRHRRGSPRPGRSRCSPTPERPISVTPTATAGLNAPPEIPPTAKAPTRTVKPIASP